MQISHFKASRAAGRSLIRWLIALSAVSMMMVIGLGIYTWQLSRELMEIRRDDRASSLISKLAGQKEQEVQRPQLFGQGPSGSSLFGQPPSAPSLFGNSGAADPFQQMEAMRQQMDSMINSFFGSSMPSFGSLSGNSSLFGSDPFASMGLNQPSLSLRETDSALEVVIPVQEGQQFELNTDVQEDRLTVAGTVTWSAEDSGNGIVSSRRGSSQFSRTIMLPDTVDPARLTTEHRGDEIVITLPKA